MAIRSSRHARSQRRQASVHTRQCSVHPGTALALVAAVLADGHLGLEQRRGDVGVVLGLADDPGSSAADVGALQHSRMHLIRSETFRSLKSASASEVQA